MYYYSNPAPLIVFIVIGLPMICITIIVLARQRSKHAAKKLDANKDDEAKVIDQVYWGLKDLRQRIDNLETIIFKDSERNGGKT